jgi:hypothetical protein
MAKTVHGLSERSPYDFAVTAKNEDGVPTVEGPSASGTTTAVAPSKIRQRWDRYR